MPLLAVWGTGVAVCVACAVAVGAMVSVGAMVAIASVVAVDVGLRVGGIIIAAVGMGTWVGTAVGVGYNPFGAPSQSSHPCSN